jgi:hypothetical protein
MYKYKDYTVIDHFEEEAIADLLLYRKIVEVKGDTLILDNGVQLEVHGNEGCGGCASGNYYVTELNECDNAITKVEFDVDEDESDWGDRSFKIFVYAENQKIKILQVDGTDGNGYYGTGYDIRVRYPNKE